jgi:hypothetical protein
MHGSMGGGRKPAPVGKSARSQAPLAYPTNLSSLAATNFEARASFPRGAGTSRPGEEMRAETREQVSVAVAIPVAFRKDPSSQRSGWSADAGLWQLGVIHLRIGCSSEARIPRLRPRTPTSRRRCWDSRRAGWPTIGRRPAISAQARSAAIPCAWTRFTAHRTAWTQAPAGERPARLVIRAPQFVPAAGRARLTNVPAARGALGPAHGGGGGMFGGGYAVEL